MSRLGWVVTRMTSSGFLLSLMDLDFSLLLQSHTLSFRPFHMPVMYVDNNKSETWIATKTATN